MAPIAPGIVVREVGNGESESHSANDGVVHLKILAAVGEINRALVKDAVYVQLHVVVPAHLYHVRTRHGTVEFQLSLDVGVTGQSRRRLASVSVRLVRTHGGRGWKGGGGVCSTMVIAIIIIQLHYN